MDSAETTKFNAQFEITTRCDSCEQSYHGKARVGVSPLGFLAQDKAQSKMDQKVDQVISEFKGVGVQRCPHCGHLQSWNIEETSDVYARWWTLGITALAFSIYFVYTFATSGFDPSAPGIWLNLIKLVAIPLITYYVANLILVPVSRGYYAVKYYASENFKPEITLVDE
jgi:hypothetical protein